MILKIWQMFILLGKRIFWGIYKNHALSSGRSLDLFHQWNSTILTGMDLLISMLNSLCIKDSYIYVTCKNLKIPLMNLSLFHSGKSEVN